MEPSPGFELRALTVSPVSERPYDETEWRDALVVVQRGEIELEWLSGACRRFRCGDLLWLTGLSLRTLRNRGDDAAVLLSVTRR
jgi:hypothetical protein